MKFFIIIISAITLLGCNTKEVSKETRYKAIDTIVMLNGDDKEVKITYEIFKFNYSEMLKNISNEKFKALLNSTAKSAKSYCKNELTYEPKRFEISIKNDKVFVQHKFSAKSSMGVPGLMSSESDFARNGEFITSRLISTE